jgi:AraC family transcriptional regulator
MNSEETSDSPVVSKRGARWDGLRLVHYRMKAGYMPEHNSPEHLITLSLSEKCNGEIRTAAGLRAGAENRGSVCVIPSGQSYSAELNGESELLAIFLDPKLVIKAARDSSSGNRVEIVEACTSSDNVINSVGMALFAELRSENVGGRLYAQSLGTILAVHMLRHYSAQGEIHPQTVGGLTGRRLTQVIDFIRDNYSSDLSLEELASVAGMSTFHFAREFKRSTGITPHQYLLNFRIDRAKEMLSDGKLSLSDVGLQSGFSHQSHFTRLFRRLTGTTPLNYRLNFQS